MTLCRAASGGLMKSIIKSKKVMLAAIIIILATASIITAVAVRGGNKKRLVLELLSTGVRYVNELRYEDAIIAFEKVIEIEPKNITAYLGLTDAYEGLNKPEKAIKVLQKAAKILEKEYEKEDIPKEGADIFIRLADLYEKDGDKEEAYQTLRDGFDITESSRIAMLLKKEFNKEEDRAADDGNAEDKVAAEKASADKETSDEAANMNTGRDMADIEEADAAGNGDTGADRAAIEETETTGNGNIGRDRPDIEEADAAGNGNTGRDRPDIDEANAAGNGNTGADRTAIEEAEATGNGDTGRDMAVIDTEEFKLIDEFLFSGFFYYQIDNVNGCYLMGNQWDLNMDGSQDIIIISLQPYWGEGNDKPYIEVNGSRVEFYFTYSDTGQANFIDLDSEDNFIEIAVFDFGPSDDYHYKIFRYNGEKVYLLFELSLRTRMNGRGQFILGEQNSILEPYFCSGWYELEGNDLIEKRSNISSYMGKKYTLPGGFYGFAKTNTLPERIEDLWAVTEYNMIDTCEVTLIDVYQYPDSTGMFAYLIKMPNGKTGLITLYSD